MTRAAAETPEIQQAVHAVRALRRELAEKGTATVDGAFIAAQFQVLASAYIDDLEQRDRESAEQGQAINRAWLESIGFIESVRSAVTLRLPADDDLFIWHEGGKWRPAFEQGFAGYIRLALCSTRGDVLRLLAALGINAERGGE